MVLSLDVSRQDGHDGICVSIKGPWYEDSDPTAFAPTEEEATKKALDELEEMYRSIGAFLKKHGRREEKGEEK